MRFKCRLKVILAEKEIRQKEFAEKVGINRSTLSALATGQNLPSFTTAYLIAKELDLKIEDIWILEEEK